MVISKKTSLATFGVFALFLVLVGWLEYEHQPRSPEPVEKAAAPPSTAPEPVKVEVELVEATDMQIERSKIFRTDGDLRPFWVISGRIQNRSEIELKSVTLRIALVRQYTFLKEDETILSIESEILPHGVSAFSRTVQLLPPKTAWTWTVEVVKADAK